MTERKPIPDNALSYALREHEARSRDAMALFNWNGDSMAPQVVRELLACREILRGIARRTRWMRVESSGPTCVWCGEFFSAFMCEEDIDEIKAHNCWGRKARFLLPEYSDEGEK